MSIAPETFEEFETDNDLFSLRVDGALIWERIRFDVFREIKKQNGVGQAHTQNNSGIAAYLQGTALWAKNFIHRNPFFADEHEFLFVGHPRRKLEEDGYWWDLYCDPIHEGTELDAVHMEEPHLVSHRTPAKTEGLRYLELIEYSGTLQRGLGIRSPTLSDEVISQLREAETEIQQRFDATVDLVAEAKESAHTRKATLPMYERLLDRIDPSVVVLVVSYYKETLVEACKRKGIPVVELQHGVIYDYHYGYSFPEGVTKEAFPDYLFTFGEFWNENVRFPLPDDRIIPVGHPYLEQRIEAYDDVNPRNQIIFISQGTIGHQLSQFALTVHDDPRIDYDVVYKLHPGEYDRWKDEYPWLVDSGMTVIDESEPPLYRLFAESDVQIGVGSTAVYEGLSFDLETYVYDCDGSDVLEPLVEDGVASFVENVDDLVERLGSEKRNDFDVERFFKTDAIQRVQSKLTAISNSGESVYPP